MTGNQTSGRVRLITFMGRDPLTVRYALGRRGNSTDPRATHRGRFTGAALFNLLGQDAGSRAPDEIIVLSTRTAADGCREIFRQEAERTNKSESPLEVSFSGERFAGRPVAYLPEDFDAGDGMPDPLWETFRIVRQFLDVTGGGDAEHCGTQDQARPDTIILDITHGFRITPFIAAAALVHQRMLDSLRYERMNTKKEIEDNAPAPPPPPRYLVYAAPDPDPDRLTVIHDISGFVDMLAWTDSLGLFLRGGRLPNMGKRPCRHSTDPAPDADQPAKASAFPPLPGLEADQLDTVQAFLDELANVEADMLTMRTGDLLTGGWPNREGPFLDETRQPGSAERARAALENARDEISKHAPPVDSVLEELELMLAPLALNKPAVQAGLGQGAGLDALRALSERYLQVGRYLEALTMAVEGWTGMMAGPDEIHATDPNAPQFLERENGGSQKGADLRREILAKRLDQYIKLKESSPEAILEYKRVRNELNHGGFTKLNKDSSKMTGLFMNSVRAFRHHNIDPCDVNEAENRRRLSAQSREKGGGGER